MEKPLYPITCGDLGSSADDVEKNLKKHFTLASRWDCVMLLDEADVFLAKRMLENLQRNSIVSVFLRMLEYYKGLLFLTTNRVGTFDEAFTSRVHISLFCKYGPSPSQHYH
jgi:SpoVK/Ycf46/Vps4 family AAA+-type ATPase